MTCFDGTSGHMGSDGATFDQNITWCFEFGQKLGRIRAKFLGACQLGSNPSVCFGYAAAVYNFLHTTAY